MSAGKIKGLADQRTCKDLHLHLPAKSRGQAVSLLFPIPEAYLRHAHSTHDELQHQGQEDFVCNMVPTQDN